MDVLSPPCTPRPSRSAVAPDLATGNSSSDQVIDRVPAATGRWTVATIRRYNRPVREYTIYATQDEAIAVALGGATLGEIVEVHDAACKLVEDPESGDVVEPCTCAPLVLTVGARA